MNNFSFDVVCFTKKYLLAFICMALLGTWVFLPATPK
jgi:hypothetical protein